MSLRIRSVKPDYWRDRLLAALPADVREFYVGLWMEADDAGWLRWRPEEIAADLYPYRAVRTRERNVERWGARLAELGRLEMHSCGHAVIPTLARHQFRPGHPVETIEREHRRDCHGEELPGPGTRPKNPKPAEALGSPRKPAEAPPGKGGLGEGLVKEGSRAGAREEDSTDEASRESVIDYLRNLWRADPSEAQRGILDEIADRRKAPGRSGWTWISETMQARPDGTDPLEVVMTEDRRLSDEGLARADAEEAAWNETKRKERERLDGVPRGQRLVQDPETNVWFPAEEATG